MRKYRNQRSGKVQVIYFSTSKRGRGKGWRGSKKQLIGSQSLFLIVAVESEARRPFQVVGFCRKRRRERQPTLVGVVRT